MERLVVAIKLIYASVYFKNARNYTEATGNRTEEEKMAVILQKIVGRNRDGYFYPVLSGVARSYNFYSVGRIKPREGIAYTALGLGKTIMEGENCLFFSPANPQVPAAIFRAIGFSEEYPARFFRCRYGQAQRLPQEGR